jgi:nucleotide-binding universal stress UspA family protein
MFPLRVILHPTDLSEHSRYAAQIAADLARQHSATLLVVHVVETLGPENATYGEIVTEPEPESYCRRLDEELRRFVPAPAGVAIQYWIAAGEPAQEIERIARAQACELIVMGTHGRTGLNRLLLGSIAEQVIRRAPCPVLTTKLPAPAAPGDPARTMARSERA